MYLNDVENLRYSHFSTGVQPGQHASEKMAAGFRLQKEGIWAEKWGDEKGQHVG